MKLYYVLEWPDSQEFLGMPECYTIDNTMNVVVPVDLYNKSFNHETGHIGDVDYKL